MRTEYVRAILYVAPTYLARYRPAPQPPAVDTKLLQNWLKSRRRRLRIITRITDKRAKRSAQIRSFHRIIIYGVRGYSA
jgi:hypothetical protein